MPHFSKCCPGADEYVCQICGQIKCSGCQPSVWRPDLTGHKSAGNVCPDCLKQKTKAVVRPISLHEFCHTESGGLTGMSLERYVQRHYGLG